MKKNSLRTIFLKMGTAVMLFVSLLFPALALAQTSLYGNSGPDLGLAYPAQVGLSDTDVRITAARILRVAMGMLGTVFVAIVIWGAWEWMTAGGNEDQIGEAKKRIFTGIIGLAIILSSWAIASFVISNITNATTGANI